MSARTAGEVALKKIVLVVLALATPVPLCSQAYTPAEAIALEQQGKYADAAQAWSAVTRANPRDAAAFASLGVVLSREQKYSEAAVAYEEAIALDPKLPEFI